MATPPSVSVQGLSKTFALIERKAGGGVILDGPLGLVAALGRHVIKRRIGGSGTGKKAGKSFQALSDVTFNVSQGEVLGIVGRNGAGKSTLLKVLARTLEPSAGRVMLGGRVVSLLELGVGFAPDLTLRENIHIYGRLAGFRGQEVHAAEHRILEFARLERYRDVPLQQCPSGSFVKLAFAAMISLKADILLADEVLTVGDSEFRKQCEDRIRDVGRSGEAVLFVSHDMNAIRRICTRVLWLDKGKVRATGGTDEVIDAYTAELMEGRLLPDAGSAGKRCTLIDLRLLDVERSQTGALQMTKPSYVECIIRIDYPGTVAVLEVELWQGKIHVLTTGPMQQLTATRATMLSASFLIPADFLNEGNYRLKARLLVADMAADGTLVAAGEEKIEFTAFNSDPEQSVWADWPWGRGGLISPRLAWSVAHVA